MPDTSHHTQPEHHPDCERTGDSCLICEACAWEVCQLSEWPGDAIPPSVCPGCNGEPSGFGELWCQQCIDDANAMAGRDITGSTP